MSSIRFLLAGSRRYPEYIRKNVLELLAEADQHQALAQTNAGVECRQRQ